MTGRTGEAKLDLMYLEEPGLVIPVQLQKIESMRYFQKDSDCRVGHRPEIL